MRWYVLIGALFLLTLGGAFFLVNQFGTHNLPAVSDSSLSTATTAENPAPIPTPTLAPQCATILFGGDVMLDRNIRIKAEAAGNYDYLLADVQPLFDAADLVVVNLEGPITDNPSRSVGSVPGSTNNYFFTFDPVVVSSLVKWGMTVSLGNNHMSDFGADGRAQTYANLDAASIPYFGYIEPGQERPAYLITTVNGMQIGLVNYNQFVSGGWERTLADIAEVRPLVDVLIVYPHWGNEYVQENQTIKNMAYQLIDAGADLVVGSHPHVVQGVEDYQGQRIYYSLGNMVFDQYFEEAVQNGLLVTAEVCRRNAGETTDLSALTADQGDSFFWTFTEHPIQMLKTGETILVTD